MTLDIEKMISDAEKRAQESFRDAQREAGTSTKALQDFVTTGKAEVSLATIKDPQAPRPFVPAVPPELSQETANFGNTPKDLDKLDSLPRVMDGIGMMPQFNASPPSLQFPDRPGQVAHFDAKVPELDLSVQFDAPPIMPLIDQSQLPPSPVLSMPDQPGSVPRFDENAPELELDIQFPVLPELLSQPVDIAPIVESREAPIAPQVILPAFDGVAPGSDLSAPENLDAKYLAAYRESAPIFFSVIDEKVDAYLSKINPQFHAQLQAIEDKLSSYLQGGTALAPAVENAIHERTKDKINAEYRRTRDAAYSDAARRGLTLPDGALFSAIRQARQAGADNLARSAIDIAIKQAELEQANMQFAITTSNGLRATALQSSIAYHQNLISINAQALQAAQAVLSSMVEGFNLAVKLYATRLDAYKADAQVYEVRLRAVMAHIEKYQAEIKALESLTQVDVAKVGAYRAKIEAMTALAGVYRTQVEALVSKANLQKLKLDAFGSRVEAYRATVQGNTAEWQGYVAAVNGEEAKAKVHAEQIQGFRSLVDMNAARASTYRTQVDAEIQKASLQKLRLDGFAAQVQAYNAQANVKQAEWGGYTAAVNAETAKSRAFGDQAQAYSAQVQAWKTQVDANVSVLNGTVEKNKAKISEYTAQYQGYEARVRAEAIRVNSIHEFQKQVVTEYSAANQAAIAAYEANSRFYGVQSQVAIENGKIKMSEVLEKAKIKLTVAESITKGALQVADIYGRMSSSSLSGMNTLVTAALT